ncbi:MAG: hypothetical protein AABZ63_06065, partial [Actinomycetota bacterium]
FTQSPDRLELSRREAEDPRAAVKARLKELSRRRRSLEVRKRDFALWKWQLDHFERGHGLDPRSVADLRESLDGWMKTMLPLRRSLLDKAEPHLQECLRWFDETEGRAFLARMPGLSAHPYALALEAELSALGRRLAKLKSGKPAPQATALKARASAAAEPTASAAAVKQLDWDDITKMSDIDRAKHPEHWRNAPQTEPPLPWLIK